MKVSIGLGVFGCPHPYALDGALSSVSVKSSGTVDDVRDADGFVVGHVLRDPLAEISLSGLVHGDNIPKFGDVMDMTFLNLTFYGLAKVPITKALVNSVSIDSQQAGYTAYSVQLIFHPLVNYVTNYYSTDPDMPPDVPTWLLDAFEVSSEGYITAFTVSDTFQIVTQTGKTPLIINPDGVTLARAYPQLTAEAAEAQGFADSLPDWASYITADAKGLTNIRTSPDGFLLWNGQYNMLEANAGSMSLASGVQTVTIGNGSSSLSSTTQNPSGFGAGDLPAWMDNVQGDAQGISEIIVRNDVFHMQNKSGSITVVNLIGASVGLGLGASVLENQATKAEGFAPLDQAIVSHNPLAVGALSVGAVNDLGLVGSVIDLTNMTLTAEAGRVPTCELAFEVGDALPEVRQPAGLVWVDEGSFPALKTNRKYRFAVRVDNGVLIASDNYYFI